MSCLNFGQEGRHVAIFLACGHAHLPLYLPSAVTPPQLSNMCLTTLQTPTWYAEGGAGPRTGTGSKGGVAFLNTLNRPSVCCVMWHLELVTAVVSLTCRRVVCGS